MIVKEPICLRKRGQRVTNYAYIYIYMRIYLTYNETYIAMCIKGSVGALHKLSSIE